MKRTLAFITRYVWYTAVILLNLCGCQETVGGPVTCTTGDGACGSRYCVDGYCCDSICDGTCQACNLPGHEGNCMDVVDGEDPADECGECRVCGGGACRDVSAGDDPKDDCDQWDPSTCGLTGDCDGAGQCANYGSDTPCDDQELCTYDDHCDGQGGCSGTGITCEPDPDPCAFQPVCNGTDTCEETYPGQNTSCDDQDPCTYDDRCDGQGGCAGTAIACDDDPGPCGAKRECNGTDTCTVSYSGSETACQDNDPCTYDDRCDGQGGCAGTQIACDDGPSPCGALRDCNGTDTCTVSYPPAGIACDDGRFCTVGDQCDGAGNCSPGADTPCQAGEICYEYEDRCCQPSAYTACGDDNDVYWFDSCDHQGGIHQDCPDPNGECTNGTCHCRSHWTGADCLTCPGHWDPAQDCNACQGNWDIDFDCAWCQPGWVGDDCQTEGCVRYVHLESTATNAQGLNWSEAFINVNDGINAARLAVITDPNIDVCEVWVSQGTYYMYGSGPEDTAQLMPNVHVYGGFTATETSRDQRDWEANLTVLDGRDLPDGAARVYHVVTADGDGTIDGFTITGGSAFGPTRDDQIGGGVFARGCSPRIANCTITDNEAEREEGGAGLYFEACTGPVVENCIVSNNATAMGHGGGISLWESSGAEIINSVVQGNYADAAGGGIYITWDTDTRIENCMILDNTAMSDGAGIHSWESINATISNSTISGNTTEGSGGGVSVSNSETNSSVHIIGCEITGNSVTGGQFTMGGGVNIDGSGVVTIDGCLIRNNTASGDSGGVNVWANAVIRNTDIIENSSGFDGGAMFFYGDQNHIVDNCVISGNTSGGMGGGIGSLDAKPVISNSTIENNAAINKGGGIMLLAADAHIENCTITGNFTTGGGPEDHGGGIFTDNSSPVIDDCLVSDNSSSGHGAGISVWNTTNASISRSVITGNISGHDGGGLFFASGASTVTNCIIQGNSASSRGGGINTIGDGTQTSLINSSVIGNSATGGGDGITCADSSDLTLVNCILWENLPQEVYIPDWGSPVSITVSHSDILGGSSSVHGSGNGTVSWLAGNINADPLFFDAAGGDYHLSLGSPCIDAGTATNAPATDFEGDGRPWGSGYDIGADEYTSAP